MSRSEWSAPTSRDTAYHRASGRRHYNAVRKSQPFRRQIEVAHAWNEIAEREGLGAFSRGVQAHLAQRFTVSRATICRDLQAIRSWTFSLPCPACETPLTTTRYGELERRGKLRPHRDSAADLAALNKVLPPHRI